MKDSVRIFTKNFIKFFIYIAVFAQIVSGTVYLVCNFNEFIIYPETEEMVHAARTLVFDEYIGFLYPLFSVFKYSKFVWCWILSYRSWSPVGSDVFCCILYDSTVFWKKKGLACGDICHECADVYADSIDGFAVRI